MASILLLMLIAAAIAAQTCFASPGHYFQSTGKKAEVMGHEVDMYQTGKSY